MVEVSGNIAFIEAEVVVDGSQDPLLDLALLLREQRSFVKVVVVLLRIDLEQLLKRSKDPLPELQGRPGSLLVLVSPDRPQVTRLRNLEVTLVVVQLEAWVGPSVGVLEEDDRPQRHVGQAGTVEHRVELPALVALFCCPVFIEGLVRVLVFLPLLVVELVFPETGPELLKFESGHCAEGLADQRVVDAFATVKEEDVEKDGVAVSVTLDCQSVKDHAVEGRSPLLEGHPDGAHSQDENSLQPFSLVRETLSRRADFLSKSLCQQLLAL